MKLIKTTLQKDANFYFVNVPRPWAHLCGKFPFSKDFDNQLEVYKLAKTYVAKCKYDILNSDLIQGYSVLVMPTICDKPYKD